MTSTLDQGERALWLAVIAQSIEDATSAHVAGCNTPATNDKARQEARDWLTIPNNDFNEACALAGLEPSFVRNAAITKINNFDDDNPAVMRGAVERKAAEHEAHQSKHLSFDGITQSIEEWALDYGISARTIRDRLYKKAWSVERAITQPIFQKATLAEREAKKAVKAAERKALKNLTAAEREAKREAQRSIKAAEREASTGVRSGRLYTHDGKTLNLAAWSALTGINTATLNYRLRQGISFAEVITIKPNTGNRIAGKASPFGFANLGRTLPV